MKKFIRNLAFFGGFILFFLLLVLFIYIKHVDVFYLKFTSPRQSSFILGDSRGLEGIQPSILNKNLHKDKYDLPVFNYCFTIVQAPYGDLYTKSILKKLNPDTKDGLFILTVSPWLLAQRKNDNFNKNQFEEFGKPPHNLSNVTINPNLEYLYKNSSSLHFNNLILKPFELHRDGWLEINDLAKDHNEYNKIKKLQVDAYLGYSKNWKQCTYRSDELVNLIGVLQKHGRVVLVRMPCCKEIKNLETKFWINFDQSIKKIALKQKVSYFNFISKDDYKFLDGNHLDKFGGARFTKDLCDSINSSPF